MVEILSFGDARRRRERGSKKDATREESFSFSPEVSCGLWVAESQPVDPANSEKQVLTEILLILGAAAAAAVLLSFLAGAPTAM